MDAWMWSVLLLATGMLIVGIEVFVPSGGVLAVLAALCFAGSIVVAFLDGVRTGLLILGTTAVAVRTVIAIAFHWWPHTPIGRRILVPPPEHPDDVLPDTDEYRSFKSLVGRRGRSLGPMLPSGSVVIEHRTYDATSLGGPIDENKSVEVVEVRMNRLIVCACAGDSEPEVAASRSDEEILSRPIESLGIEDPLA